LTYGKLLRVEGTYQKCFLRLISMMEMEEDCSFFPCESYGDLWIFFRLLLDGDPECGDGFVSVAIAVQLSWLACTFIYNFGSLLKIHILVPMLIITIFVLILLKTVSGRMDKMGKVVGLTPAFKRMNKINKFSGDSTAFAPLGPAGLGKPFFISKLPASLCL